MIDFGYCLPIFSGSQDKMARTPMLHSIDDLESNIVSSVGNLNFNSLWVADHLSMPNSNSILEGWTTISWAAGITKKIKLGNIHFNNLLREPPYTAKIISSLDVLSKGRMNLFFDGGHPGTKNEVTTFGFNFLNDSERIEMLEESICLIKSLWKSPTKNFKGKYYFVDDIFFNPLPYRDRDIPIWIGTLTPSSSTNEWNERISQTVAKFGDWWNLTPIGIESYKIANQEMHNVFKKEKRDFESIKKSVELEILIAQDEKELASLKEKIRLNNNKEKFFGNWDEWSKTNLLGTPEQISEKISEYTDLGVENFMLWFLDSPSLNGAEIFSEEIIKKFN